MLCHKEFHSNYFLKKIEKTLTLDGFHVMSFKVLPSSFQKMLSPTKSLNLMLPSVEVLQVAQHHSTFTEM